MTRGAHGNVQCDARVSAWLLHPVEVLPEHAADRRFELAVVRLASEQQLELADRVGARLAGRRFLLLPEPPPPVGRLGLAPAFVPPLGRPSAIRIADEAADRL